MSESDRTGLAASLDSLQRTRAIEGGAWLLVTILPLTLLLRWWHFGPSVPTVVAIGVGTAIAAVVLRLGLAIDRQDLANDLLLAVIVVVTAVLWGESGRVDVPVALIGVAIPPLTVLMRSPRTGWLLFAGFAVFAFLYTVNDLAGLGLATPRVVQGPTPPVWAGAMVLLSAGMTYIAHASERQRRSLHGLLVEAQAELEDRVGARTGELEVATAALDRETRDRKVLEVHLAQAQKMDAVGRLAAGVAHDFNNLLTIILGYGDLIRRETGDDDAARSKIEGLLGAGERARALVRQLLVFSRADEREPALVGVNEAVEGIEVLARRLVPRDIEIVTELDPAAGAVLIAPGHLDQVLLNLLVNARDAMAEGGTLTIRTGARTLEAPANRGLFEATAGDFACIEVTDTGCGMDADTRSHVFEPFFTTKPEGEGTGLGLATVYGIVRSAGGLVDLESEPGRGAAFRVDLPLAAGAPAREPAGPVLDAGPAPRGSGRVLLVEDDPDVRSFMRRVLEGGGYEVEEAGSGPEALGLAATLQPHPDVAIIDVGLPRIGGAEVAERLRVLRASLPVLFVSGRAGWQHLEPSELPRGTHFLEKPFAPDELLGILASILSPSATGDGRRDARAAGRLDTISMIRKLAMPGEAVPEPGAAPDREPDGHQTFCAWCGSEVGEGTPGGTVSHGICDDCRDEMTRGLGTTRTA